MVEVFEAQNLKNKIFNGEITNVFERENAINWLKIHGYWDDSDREREKRMFGRW